jgi:hypothetical protein
MLFSGAIATVEKRIPMSLIVALTGLAGFPVTHLDAAQPKSRAALISIWTSTTLTTLAPEMYHFLRYPAGEVHSPWQAEACPTPRPLVKLDSGGYIQ